MSSPPVGSHANATAAATCSSIVTSATIERIEPSSPTTDEISATALANFSSVRPQIATCAPSAASRAADASPMPLPPPVTSAVQPGDAHHATFIVS